MRFILIFLFLPLLSFSQSELSTDKISENVYVIYGNGGNVGVLETESGFILVDDKFEKDYEAIMASLDSISEKPVYAVINTHFHYDHAEGNKKFGNSGAKLIAHKNTQVRLSKENIIGLPGAENPTIQKAYPKHAIPSESFDEEMTLNQGASAIKLIHVKNAHTDTDALVVFTAQNIIHTGDVFVRYGIPFIDSRNGGNYGGFINGLEKIIELSNESTKIIPGHGEVCSVTEVKELYKDLNHIYTSVGKWIKEGLSKDDILAKKDFDDLLPGSFIPMEYMLSMAYTEWTEK